MQGLEKNKCWTWMMLQGTVKIFLARVERFEGVLKQANSNKNVMPNVQHTVDTIYCASLYPSQSAYLLSGNSTDS